MFKDQWVLSSITGEYRYEAWSGERGYVRPDPNAPSRFQWRAYAENGWDWVEGFSFNADLALQAAHEQIVMATTQASEVDSEDAVAPASLSA